MYDKIIVIFIQKIILISVYEHSIIFNIIHYCFFIIISPKSIAFFAITYLISPLVYYPSYIAPIIYPSISQMFIHKHHSLLIFLNIHQLLDFHIIIYICVICWVIYVCWLLPISIYIFINYIFKEFH